MDKLVVKRRHVYYHAITFNLISVYKRVINNKIRDYELRQLLFLNGVDTIDWKYNSLTPSDDQLKEYNSSFDKFITSNNSNDSNNIKKQ